jgi:hypothetical protein
VQKDIAEEVSHLIYGYLDLLSVLLLRHSNQVLKVSQGGSWVLLDYGREG